MASTFVLPLKASKSVSGKLEAPGSQVATCVRLTLVDIVITAVNKVTLELTYGNMVNGDFVPLDVDTAKMIINMDTADIDNLANVQLSPAEKEMTPLKIIGYRLMSYLYAKWMIKV